MTAQVVSAASLPDVLESRRPATGEVVATFPVDGDESVRVAVRRAREAAGWWAELGFDGRRDRLMAWKRVIVRRIDQVATLMHEETGKPFDDARLELIAAIEHLDWAAKHAQEVLGPRKVRSGPLAMNIAATVRYQPLGVVGVIGPWNYPALTPMGSIGYALAAGNAVVFKPSEHSPAVGVWLADTFAEVVPELPVFTASTFAGMVVAFLLAAVFPDASSLSTLAGIGAAISVLGAVVLIAALRLPGQQRHAAPQVGLSAFRLAWGDRLIKRLCLLVLFPFGTFVALTTFGQALLKPAGVDADTASLILLVNVVAGSSAARSCRSSRSSGARKWPC